MLSAAEKGGFIVYHNTEMDATLHAVARVRLEYAKEYFDDPNAKQVLLSIMATWYVVSVGILAAQGCDVACVPWQIAELARDFAAHAREQLINDCPEDAPLSQDHETLFQFVPIAKLLEIGLACARPSFIEEKVSGLAFTDLREISRSFMEMEARWHSLEKSSFNAAFLQTLINETWSPAALSYCRAVAP